LEILNSWWSQVLNNDSISDEMKQKLCFQIQEELLPLKLGSPGTSGKNQHVYDILSTQLKK
jgi:hypothetical protein